MVKMNQYQIAEILHNATSAIPRSDGSVIVPWDVLNDVLKDKAADTVRNLMSLLPTFKKLDADYCHLIWLINMRDMGWSYAPTYSLERKEHPSIVPFDDLPTEEKIKDAIWSGILYALQPYYTEA